MFLALCVMQWRQPLVDCELTITANALHDRWLLWRHEENALIRLNFRIIWIEISDIRLVEKSGGSAGGGNCLQGCLWSRQIAAIKARLSGGGEGGCDIWEVELRCCCCGAQRADRCIHGHLG